MNPTKKLKCGVVWCGVVWCGVVWCGVVWCGVVWVVWCGVVWCGVVWCGVGDVVLLWCVMVWCSMAWRGVAWRGVAWRGVCVCVFACVYVCVFVQSCKNIFLYFNHLKQACISTYYRYLFERLTQATKRWRNSSTYRKLNLQHFHGVLHTKRRLCLIYSCQHFMNVKITVDINNDFRMSVDVSLRYK